MCFMRHAKCELFRARAHISPSSTLYFSALGETSGVSRSTRVLGPRSDLGAVRYMRWCLCEQSHLERIVVGEACSGPKP